MSAPSAIPNAVQVGGTIPAVEVKENSPTEKKPLVLKGKNVIVRNSLSSSMKYIS
jgi:hypothetical protein